MVELGDGWREIIVPPLEEGERMALKPNFDPFQKISRWKLGWHKNAIHFVKKEENSSWSLIKDFFKGRLNQMIYKRIECNRGNVDYCYAVDAIKGDDTVMGHIVSMVLGQSVVSMSTDKQEIWLHDLSTPRQFPYKIVKTRTGWSLENNCNQNAKLLYNTHYLIMVVQGGYTTDIYFYKTPCCNTSAIR